MKKFTPFKLPIHLTFILAFSVLVSCNQPENQQEMSADETELTTSVSEQVDWNLPTMYTGTLPCADCPGINYRLIIEEEQFTEISHYQDRSIESFEETGTWEIDGDTLTLRGRENLILKRFLVDESNLTLLSRTNQKITGDLADMYVLNRTGDQQSIEEHHRDLADRGYAFFATGNEPFWSIQIDSLDQLIFESPEKELNFGKINASTIRNEMQFETSTDSTQLSVQIRDEYCQDSMSGYLFPLIISVTMQPFPVDTLEGCGLFLDSKNPSNFSDSIQ